MKAIFSHWSANGSTFFCDKDMAKMSNDLAQKNGYKTCLYTDKNGFEKLNSYVSYDEIILFDEKYLLNFFPKIWSLGKVLAMSLINEPFMHLDFDLFLYKNLKDNVVKKDFFTFYSEPWLDAKKNVQSDVKKIFNLYPDKKDLNINQINSYNFAIIGGQRFKEINFVCKKIINFANTYKEDLIKLNDIGFDSPSWILAVTFEQILIPNLLKTIFNIENHNIIPIEKNKKDDSDDIIGEFLIDRYYVAQLKKYFISNKIIHLHGRKKEKFEYLKKSNKFI